MSASREEESGWHGKDGGLFTVDRTKGPAIAAVKGKKRQTGRKGA